MVNSQGKSTDHIKFIGTSGGRVVLSKQLRSSGGLWFCLSGQNFLVDPGPGSLVRLWSSNPPLDPTTLDGIILTHRHLDHSGDLNAVVEAMADGGFHPRGEVFAPSDALDGPEPILFHYLRHYLKKINVLSAGASFTRDDLTIASPIRHKHPVETYGVKFTSQGKTISYISDTKYFPALEEAYRADLLIINMTFLNAYHSPNACHLSFEEVGPLIAGIRPGHCILTHFGKKVLDAGPEDLALRLSQETGISVIAAYDGMYYSIK